MHSLCTVYARTLLPVMPQSGNTCIQIRYGVDVTACTFIMWFLLFRSKSRLYDQFNSEEWRGLRPPLPPHQCVTSPVASAERDPSIVPDVDEAPLSLIGVEQSEALSTCADARICFSFLFYS